MDFCINLVALTGSCSSARLADRTPCTGAYVAPELSLKVYKPHMGRPSVPEHVMPGDGGAVAAPARGLDNMPLP